MARTPCEFPGCDRPTSSRGLCESHAWQRKKGKPLTPIPVRPKTLEAYFWARVEVRTADECWEWTGFRERPNQKRHCHLPYGVVATQLGTTRRRYRMAHRVSWEMHNGPIPEGLFVLHHCDNPPCVNPAHLYLGTHEQNMADRDQRGRLGRRDGEHNGRAKLNDEAVRDIRARYKPGVVSQQLLADEYGVSQSTIGLVVTRRGWGAVP